MGTVMRVRDAVGVGAILLAAGWPAAAGDPPAVDGYARVEVRGLLERFQPAPIRRPQEKGHIVTVGRGTGRQSFHLDLPTDALRAKADELAGQAVVLSGELSVREVTDDRPKGDPLRENVIRVKDLKKADPPRK
jgi:hypothetical protein